MNLDLIQILKTDQTIAVVRVEARMVYNPIIIVCVLLTEESL